MRGSRTSYRIVAGHEGLQVELDENFFDNAIVRKDGTTQVDVNIATLCQEIRTALYYLATDNLSKH
jgi:hypothetical protein